MSIKRIRIFSILLFLLFLGTGLSLAQEEENVHGFRLNPEHISFVIFPAFDEVSPAEQTVEVACTNAVIKFEGADKCTYLCPVDCENTTITWQFVAGESWLSVSPSSETIQSHGYVTLSINKDMLSHLPAESCELGGQSVPCYTSDLILHVRYLIQGCTRICEGENGPVQDIANVDYFEEITYENFATIYVSHSGYPIEAYPSELNFTGVIGDDGISWLEDQAVVLVFSSLQGWEAWTNVPWLDLQEEQGQLLVQPNDNFPCPGSYEGEITIRDRRTGETITVKVSVEIDSGIKVYPSNVTFLGELENGVVNGLDPTTIQVLADFNDWDFSTDAPWLNLQKTAEGLYVQPDAEYFKALGPGVHQGTITIRYRPTGETIDINVVVEIQTALRVSPANIYFTGVIGDDGISWLEDQITIMVFGGSDNLEVKTEASWLDLSFDAQNRQLTVQPNGNFPAPGSYRTQIEIQDPTTGETKTVQVSVELEAEDGSLDRTVVYQLLSSSESPIFDTIEALTTQWLHIIVDAGSLANSGRIYVEATHSAFPGYVYAYTGLPNASFDIASQDGQPVPYVDDLFYSLDASSRIEIGPLRLFYLPGRAVLTIKQGPSWQLAQPLIILQIDIGSLSGSWQIIDLLCEDQKESNCLEYPHPWPLEINESPGSLEATWGPYEPSIRYGTTNDVLYEITFQAPENGVFMKYKITNVSGGRIEGEWSYSYDGLNFEGPYPFYGLRLNIFPGAKP